MVEGNSRAVGCRRGARRLLVLVGYRVGSPPGRRCRRRGHPSGPAPWLRLDLSHGGSPCASRSGSACRLQECAPRVSPARRSGISGVSARLTPSTGRGRQSEHGYRRARPPRGRRPGQRARPRDRVVLSALVVRAGDPSSTEALADVLWGDDLPPSWAKVVHGCVARLRKRLGAAAIESGAAGYRLTVNETELDSRRFERLFEHAREALAGGDPDRTSYLVQEALDLWRGRALADLEEWEPGRVEAARLEGLRMDAEELRVEAETRAGRARDVLERARALVARGALPGAALGAARGRAAPGRAAGRGPGRAQAGTRDAGRAARPRPRARAGGARGAAAPAGPRPWTRWSRGRSASPAPTAACCRTTPRTPTRSSAGRPTWRRASASSGTRGVLAVVGPSGIGKSSLVRAGVVASLVRSGAPVLVTTPGARPTESLGGLRAGGRPSWWTRPRRRVTDLPGRRGAGAVLRRTGRPRRRGWRAGAVHARRPPRRPGAVPGHRAAPRGGPLPAGPDERARPAQRHRGPRPPRRAAAGAGPGRPAGPRRRGRAGRPAAALARAAGDLGASRGADADRRRLPGHRRDPGRGVPDRRVAVRRDGRRPSATACAASCCGW